jgi:hypothetical protein
MLDKRPKVPDWASSGGRRLCRPCTGLRLGSLVGEAPQDLSLTGPPGASLPSLAVQRVNDRVSAMPPSFHAAKHRIRPERHPFETPPTRGRCWQPAGVD